VIITLTSNHFSASVNNRNASIVLFYEYAKFVRILSFIITVIWSTSTKLHFCKQDYLPFLNFLSKCHFISLYIQHERIC